MTCRTSSKLLADGAGKSSRTVGEDAAPGPAPDPGRASGVLHRDGVRRLTGKIDEVRPRSCATTCRPASPVDQGGTPDPQMHRGHDASPTHRVPARPARRLLLLPDRLHRPPAVRDDGRRGAHPRRRRARLGGPRRAQRRGRRHRHRARRPAARRRRRPARPAPGPRPGRAGQRRPARRLRARRRQHRPGPRRPRAVGADRRLRAADRADVAHPAGRDHQAADPAGPSESGCSTAPWPTSPPPTRWSSSSARSSSGCSPPRSPRGSPSPAPRCSPSSSSPPSPCTPPAGSTPGPARARANGRRPPASSLDRPLLTVVAGTLGVGIFFGATLTASPASSPTSGDGDRAGLLYGVMGIGSAALALGSAALPGRGSPCGPAGSSSARCCSPRPSATPRPARRPASLVALAVLGFGIGPTLVALYSLAATLSPAGRSATTMTMLGSAVVVGQAVASAVTGARRRPAGPGDGADASRPRRRARRRRRPRPPATGPAAGRAGAGTRRRLSRLTPRRDDCGPGAHVTVEP